MLTALVLLQCFSVSLSGSKPMNTHGGMLSYCHPGNPGAMFGLTEAITQMRGDAGDRQLPNVRTALCHAQGGIMSSHATIILGVGD